MFSSVFLKWARNIASNTILSQSLLPRRLQVAGLHPVVVVVKDEPDGVIDEWSPAARIHVPLPESLEAVDGGPTVAENAVQKLPLSVGAQEPGW